MPRFCNPREADIAYKEGNDPVTSADKTAH